jgi:uncharacterized protein YggE
MKYITCYFLIALITNTVSVSGQVKNEQIDTRPYIDVTGTAEKEVVPDEIFINIVLRERYENKEKMTIDIQEEKLKTSLKEIGIDIKNLVLSDANADYVKIKWKTKDLLTEKDYTLKVTNADAVSKVFGVLDKLTINDAFILKVSHSLIDSLKKEVKIKAIQAAKAKADYLLAAIGEKTGKAIVVEERDYALFQQQNRFLNEVVVNSNYSNQGLNYKEKEEDVIQFQKIKIQSGVFVKFLIL